MDAGSPEVLQWIKASASANMGACVQLAQSGDMVLVRDSKRPDGPMQVYTRDEFAMFIDRVKKGEFDHLV